MNTDQFTLKLTALCVFLFVALCVVSSYAVCVTMDRNAQEDAKTIYQCELAHGVEYCAS